MQSDVQIIFETMAGGPLPSWGRLANELAPAVFQPGDFVFRQGEPNGRVYVVRAGFFKLFYLSEDGKEKTKSFIPGNGLFASISSFESRGKCTFSAVAMEKSDVVSFEYSKIVSLFDTDPAMERVARRFFQELSARKEKREYELLVLSAEKRYQSFITENPALAKRLSQIEIAKYIGITPVALSRIRARMQSSATRRRQS